MPTPPGQGFDILEFGAILVCPRKLVELYRYSTLVRPAVSSAPPFRAIADTVYELLHGRIWAGHNILNGNRIREAFAKLDKVAPEPKATIDTLELFTQRFGRRTGDTKLDSLAMLFGLGLQGHRSLDNIQMNIHVFKNCAAGLFLESILPDIFPIHTDADQMVNSETTSANLEVDEGLSSGLMRGCQVGASSEGLSSGCSGFMNSHEVSLDLISAQRCDFAHQGPLRIKLLHKDVILQLCCNVKVVFGPDSRKYLDSFKRPKLSFVANAPSDLCQVLDACDAAARKIFEQSDSSSRWNHVVNKSFYRPTIRLNIPAKHAGNIVLQYETEIYKNGSKVIFSQSNEVSEIEALITPGIYLEAYFSIDYYDYHDTAGIRLVAKKLTIC